MTRLHTITLLLALTVLSLGCTRNPPQEEPVKQDPVEEDSGESKIIAEFTPENPHKEATATPPAESKAEVTAKDFWNTLAAGSAEGPLNVLRHTTAPLLGMAYGITREDAEAALPRGWKVRDYTNENQQAFASEGIDIHNYDFGADYLLHKVATSPPGSGGNKQASPRLTLYFYEDALIGGELNLTDLKGSDADLVEGFKADYGPFALLHQQDETLDKQNWVKTVAATWSFGNSPLETSSIQLKMLYIGPLAGDSKALLTGQDRLYGRMLRFADNSLQRVMAGLPISKEVRDAHDAAQSGDAEPDA